MRSTTAGTTTLKHFALFLVMACGGATDPGQEPVPPPEAERQVINQINGVTLMQCVSESDCESCTAELIAEGVHPDFRCVYLPCVTGDECSSDLVCRPNTDSSDVSVCRVPRIDVDEMCFSENQSAECEPGLRCAQAEDGDLRCLPRAPR
jgi:hypothetical protein